MSGRRAFGSIRKNRSGRYEARYTGPGLRVKMCVWLGVSRGLDLAFLNAD